MTEHLKEIEELSKLKLGIILLIKELDSYKRLNGIQNYLKDLVEGVDGNTIKANQEHFDKVFGGDE